MTLAAKLDQALRAAGLPIVGVSLGREEDRATWTVQFTEDADATQQKAAAQLVTDFDPAVEAVPVPSVEISTLTLEQVLTWTAGKLGVSYEDARQDIEKQRDVALPR